MGRILGSVGGGSGCARFSIPLRDGDLLLMEPPAQMRLQQQALLNLTFRAGRSA